MNLIIRKLAPCVLAAVYFAGIKLVIDLCLHLHLVQGRTLAAALLGCAATFEFWIMGKTYAFLTFLPVGFAKPPFDPPEGFQHPLEINKQDGQVTRCYEGKCKGAWKPAR